MIYSDKALYKGLLDKVIPYRIYISPTDISQLIKTPIKSVKNIDEFFESNIPMEVINIK